MVGERGNQDTTLGRPRNIRRSFWWLVILIFLVLCQTGRASYLCDHQPTNQNKSTASFGAFSGVLWSQVHRLAALASRRCCVEDDTDCSSRSWSVSIQTVVVVVPKASSVLPCPGKGGWMAMHEEALKDDWSDSSNETRFLGFSPALCSGRALGIYLFTTLINNGTDGSVHSRSVTLVPGDSWSPGPHRDTFGSRFKAFFWLGSSFRSSPDRLLLFLLLLWCTAPAEVCFGLSPCSA